MTSHFIPASQYTPYPALSPSNFHTEIQHKSILITGGGSGIGASIAHAFAEAGASSIKIIGRTEARLRTTVDELQAQYSGLNISYAIVDLTSKESIAALFESLGETAGFDVLVNNAGYLPSLANVVDVEIDEFWKGFTVNVLGTVMLTQAFLRHRRGLKERSGHDLSEPTKKRNKELDKPATVVTVNSLGAYSIRVPGMVAYASSKLASARFMEILSEEIEESEAHFFSVHPGAVRTEMYDKAEIEGMFTVTDAQLAGQFMVWLATEQAAFLNGRFVWVNWEIGELLALREEIVKEDLFRTSIKGGEFTLSP